MQLAEIVRIFKGLEEGNIVREIPIFNDGYQYIGKLKPIDIELVQDQMVIESLTKWRQKFMHFFMTQFEATPERTKKWLKEVVLIDDSRLLFLIYDENNKLIGNLGICNIQEQSIELDNVVRGEKVQYKKFMFSCITALIIWILNILVVNTIYLKVFTTNNRAINLYSSLRFNAKQIFALQKDIKNLNEVTYTTMPFSPPEGQLGLILMELDKSYFVSSYYNSGNQ